MIHTYRDRQRSFREARSGRRSVVFSMYRGHEAYDAELPGDCVWTSLPSSERGRGVGLHVVHGLPGDLRRIRPRARTGDSDEDY